jgi:membrane associated rhomboid family serine protease
VFAAPPARRYTVADSPVRWYHGAKGGLVMRSSWGGDNGFSAGGWVPFSFQSVPAVRGLIVATVVVFLAYFFAGLNAGLVIHWLEFSSGPGDLAWLYRPWTWFTSAFVETSPLSLLFHAYWLYSFGGMLERSWGSRNFLALFFAFAAIGVLVFIPASLLLGKSVTWGGLDLVLAAVTVAWAALDPELDICFWFIPMKAKTLAALFVLLVFFSVGLSYRDPVLAFFTLAAPAAAWYYVRKMPRLNLGSPFGGQRAPRREPLLREPLLREDPPRERVTRRNPLRRRQEQQEIERLRKLLGEDDDGDRATRH